MKDNKTILAVGQQAIEVWDVVSGQKTRQVTMTRNGINQMGAISPDEKYLAGVSAQRELILWDLSTSKHAKYLDSRLPTFSPDGKLFAIATTAEIRIWNFSDFKMTLAK